MAVNFLPEFFKDPDQILLVDTNTGIFYFEYKILFFLEIG